MERWDKLKVTGGTNFNRTVNLNGADEGDEMHRSSKTPQKVGTDVLSTFMDNPGVNPGPGWVFSG